MSKPKEGYNINMSYDFYKDQQSTRKTSNTLPRAEYRRLCQEINKEISNVCLAGHHVELPAKLGILKVVKRQTSFNNLRVDFDSTKKLGTVIYHLNLHSDGWYGSWKWVRFTSHVGRSFHYVFKPVSTNSERVAKAFTVKDGHKQFTT